MRPQVLRVAPFVPHLGLLGEQDEAALQQEMHKVQSRLAVLRSNIYYQINEVLQKRVAELPTGVALLDAPCLLPPPPFMAALLKVWL